MKPKTWIPVVSIVLIFLGLFVTAGSHIYVLTTGLELELVTAHSILNLLASAFILLGTAGLTWRSCTK